MINDQKIDIVFATPSYTHGVSVEYHRGMLETQHYLNQAGYLCSFMHRPGDCFIDKVRNKLVTDFLNDPNARETPNFMFIDDDVGGWDPVKIHEFMVRPDDIVAGVYPRKSTELEWPVELGSDEKTGLLVEDQGLVYAMFAPTGFMRIKRHVLEHFAAQGKMFKDLDIVNGASVPKSYYAMFDAGPQADGWYWGEDFSFCRKAREAGFAIWIDPTVHFTHRGSKKWEATMADSMLTFRRKAMEAHEQRQTKEAAE